MESHARKDGVSHTAPSMTAPEEPQPWRSKSLLKQTRRMEAVMSYPDPGLDPRPCLSFPALVSVRVNHTYTTFDLVLR